MVKTYPIFKLYLQNETLEFREHDIISATVTQEINPLSLEVPSAKLDISIYTTNPDFNPFSSGRYYQSLAANIKADLFEYYDGEEIYIGQFYLEEWDNPSEGVLAFSLQDAIGVMENIPFDGTFYEDSTSLNDIIKDIAVYAPTEISLDADIANLELKGYIPGNINLRQALQQICFAVGAYAETKGTDHILLKPIQLPNHYVVSQGYYYDNALSTYDGDAVYSDFIVDGVITDLQKTNKQELKILPMVTDIELITHDYIKSATKETIFSDTLEPGDYKIVYPKPYGDVSLWGAGDVPEALGTEDGVTVLITEAGGAYPDVTILGKTGTYQSGSNSISLHVTTTGSVLIEGYPYEDNMQSIGWKNPDSIQTYNAGALYDNAAAIYDLSTYWREWSILAPQNIWKVTEGTLVNRAIGSTVLDRLIQYANARHQQTITALTEKEVQPGLLYQVDSLYGKKLIATVELVISKLSDGYLKEVRLTGVEKLEA